MIRLTKPLNLFIYFFKKQSKWTRSKTHPDPFRLNWAAAARNQLADAAATGFRTLQPDKCGEKKGINLFLGL